MPNTAIFFFDPARRLSDAVDFDSLVEKLAKSKGVVRCEVIEDPRAGDFVESLNQGLRDEEIDRILWVGRFSPHQQQELRDVFASAGLNPFLQEWCDLEEQGIHLDNAKPEIRSRKAIVVLRMALARTLLLEALEAEERPGSDSVLVIGGGVAGLYAANALANLGKAVNVVEKQAGVGGKVALLSRFYPLLCDPHCGLDFILRQPVSKPIAYHTLSRLTALEGQPGAFSASIEKQPRFVSESLCNACGECIAVCPVDLPVHLDVVQDVPPVSTQTGIGALIPSTRKAVHSPTPMAFPPAFVVERDHCPEGCRECEKACPTRAIDLDQKPCEETFDAGAVIVATGWDPYPLSNLEEFGYGKLPRVIGNLEMERLLQSSRNEFDVGSLKEVGFIQCAGSRDDKHLKYCSSVCCSATLKQISHLKALAPETRCTVFFQDIRSPGFDEDLYREVAAMGGVVFVRGLPSMVEAAANNRLSVTAEDTLGGGPVSLDLDLLVLAGGIIPSRGTSEVAEILGLPRNRYDFFESHHQCFPGESQRTGIYVGGACREPMNVAASIESSHHAAMNALAFLGGPVRVAPTFPIVDNRKCDQCKRCVEECPYSSFVIDEKGFPYPDLAKCRQCGNCMGVCPVIAISMRHNTIKQMANQVEAFDTGFMGDEEPTVLAFLCENDAWLAARSAVDQGLQVPANVIHLKVPCAGVINNAIVADALANGIDGVLIGGCHDAHCHTIAGSSLVRKRSGDLSDKLNSMMIEPERVRFEAIEIRDEEKYVALLNAYIAELREMGPNPLKI